MNTNLPDGQEEEGIPGRENSRCEVVKGSQSPSPHSGSHKVHMKVTEKRQSLAGAWHRSEGGDGKAGRVSRSRSSITFEAALRNLTFTPSAMGSHRRPQNSGVIWSDLLAGKQSTNPGTFGHSSP